MANPQLENGHTRIANEILEALISANLSGQEMSAALFVIRKTYGFGKKEDYIALSQFQESMNISKTRASQVINSLQEKKILTVKENINGLTKKYIFNKYLKQWNIPLRKTLTVKKKRNNRSSISKEPLRKTLTTKEKTKETTTKEIEIPSWLEQELFNEYIAMRIRIKKPLTDYAIKLAINKLGKFKEDGYCPNDILKESIMNCWQGLFTPKTKPKIDIKDYEVIIDGESQFLTEPEFKKWKAEHGR